MSYTEFLNAIEILNGHPYIWEKLSFSEFERPVVFQIFDDNPERLEHAVAQIQRLQPDIIDINMGCSSPAVSSRGAGAGLLRTPAKIADIFQRLTRAFDIPITGKIRLGWDAAHLNYLEVARIVQENGGKLLAVHARTKTQAYGGEANWDAIAEIKQALSIPVLGNGDVRTVVDIARMKNHTGCDGVMIGRAAIGNPWVFSRLNRTEVPLHTVMRTINRHLDLMLAALGPRRGLILFRKHVNRYLSPYTIPREILRCLLTTETETEFRSLVTVVLQDPALTYRDNRLLPPA